MTRLVAMVFILALATVHQYEAAADPTHRTLSADELMNTWRADYGTGQTIAPGGTVLLPRQADHASICYQKLVEAIGDNANFYLAAFGGPYHEDISGSINSIYFFRSQFLFFSNERYDQDFDDFLRLQPRYLCGRQGGQLTILIDTEGVLSPLE